MCGDIEAVQNRHTAGDQGGHGPREPGDRNLTQQRTKDRRLQQHAVNLVPAFWRRIVGLEHEAKNSETDREEYAEASYEPARTDNDSRGQREIHVHTVEQFSEGRTTFHRIRVMTAPAMTITAIG